ncbi:MAG TPA: PilZ domain-containing protein [Vicinamibacterales bacterium]
MNRSRDRAHERRREERVTGAGMRARVRPGNRLIVIDLSARGALVEAGRPLRPGSSVDVLLETEAQRGTVAARVVRCAVAAIDADNGVTYRAALCFNESCDWVREAVTPAGYGVPGSDVAGSSPARDAVDLLPAASDEGRRRHTKGAK